MAAQLPLIVLVLVMVIGCAGPPGVQPHASDQQSTTPQVVSDIRAMVIGRDETAVMQVINDLRRIGFRVEQEGLAQPLTEAQIISPRSFHDAHNAFFPVGYLWGDLLVVVEVSERAFYRRVAVKGLDCETGELLWHGDAAELTGSMDMESSSLVRGLAHRALFKGLHSPLSGRTHSSSAGEDLESQMGRRFSVGSRLAKGQ